jgi:hypothetical protein
MDEVGEMSLRMQALLLRFLETGEIQRVGKPRTGPQRARDLRDEPRTACTVAAGDFANPTTASTSSTDVPLRERAEDLPS